MKLNRRQGQPALAFDVDLTVRIYQYVGDGRIIQERLDRPQPDHLVLHVLYQPAPLGLIDRQFLVIENSFNQQSKFAPKLFAG